MRANKINVQAEDMPAASMVKKKYKVIFKNDAILMFKHIQLYLSNYIIMTYLAQHCSILSNFLGKLSSVNS